MTIRAFCLLLLFLFPGFGSLYAQKAPDLSKIKKHKDRLQKWTEYCDELIVAEKYTDLRKAGRKGLSMTKSTDYENLSLFTFYIGATFNYGVEKDSAAYYLEKSEAYGRKAKNSKRTLEALKQLHYVYANYGETKNQTRILEAFEQIIDTTSNFKVKADMYAIVGDYYIGKGQYELGLSYKLRGLKLQQKALPKANATDSTNFGVQLIVISELYVGLKKYKLALEYLKESEVFVRDYKLAIAHIFKDRMECYSFMEQPKNAKKAYSDLLLLLKNETDIACWGILIESDLILARYYTLHNDLKNALYYTMHASDLAPKYADEFLQAQVQVCTGLIYLKKREYRKALVYFKAAEPTTSEDDMELNAELKQALAETYSGLGNWKEAYRYQKEHAALQEKLTQETSKKNVAEMEARYQNEKKQGEINRLSALDTINNLKIDEARQQQIYFVVAIFAVLMIGGLFYRQSRSRKKHNAQLQILNEELVQANAIKARFFSIINHDLRSPVSNLIHFLQLQKDSPDLMDNATKDRLQTRTMNSAENLLRSMEDMLLWSKGQMKQFKPEKERVEVKKVFADLAAHFASEEDVQLLVNETSGVVLQTDPNYLQTILRNLTGNAIKALEKVDGAKIEWSAEQVGETVILKISDNGPGARAEQFKALYDDTEVVGIKTGLGLHLIRDLAQAIDCEIEVDSDDSGTSISLFFDK
jgi:signal transduction histidine kinase